LTLAGGHWLAGRNQTAGGGDAVVLIIATRTVAEALTKEARPTELLGVLQELLEGDSSAV